MQERYQVPDLESVTPVKSFKTTRFVPIHLRITVTNLTELSLIIRCWCKVVRLNTFVQDLSLLHIV